MSEYSKALSTWHKLTAITGGHSGMRNASGLMDRHGYLGGTADELCPATKAGREKIKALVKSAMAHGLCARHRAKPETEPRGKYKLADGFCPKCGKRPSYCRCGK